jgi:hypothetical protein
VIVGPPPGRSVVAGVVGDPPDPDVVDDPPQAPRQASAAAASKRHFMLTTLTCSGTGVPPRGARGVPAGEPGQVVAPAQVGSPWTLRGA